MLSTNPITRDVRIQRQAESLIANGAIVHVWRTRGPKSTEPLAPAIVTRGGVRYHSGISRRSGLELFWWLRVRLNILRIRLCTAAGCRSPSQALDAASVRNKQLLSSIRRFRPTHVHHFDLSTLELAADFAQRLGATLISDLYEAPLLLDECHTEKQRAKALQQHEALKAHLASSSVIFTVSPQLAEHYIAAYPASHPDCS
jgi:hypothetical protein